MKVIKSLIKKYQTFIKYIFVAGFSFLLDISLFFIFNLLLKNPLASASIVVSTIIARIISSLFNYFCNKNVVFQGGNSKSVIVKYYILVIVQMFVSGFSVTALYNIFKVSEVFIKIPVEIILFLINYVVQRKFIFIDKKSDSKKFKFNLKFIAIIGGILTSFTMLYPLTQKVFVIKRANTMSLTYLVLAYFLILFYKKYFNKYKRKATYIIISLIFSIFMVLGYSYDTVHSASLVFGNLELIIISIIKLISYYMLFETSIHLLDDIICNKNLKDSKFINKLWDKFNEHPFKYSFIFIIICYLPYIIAYYPGIINYDAANQIKEVMGIHTRYMDSVVLLNPNMTLTNFNPLIHTFLLGGLFKFGYLLGNVNFGLFLYTIVQVVIMVSALSYSIYYMKREKVNKTLILITLFIYAFVPFFPFYSITAVKDVIFSSLVLIYVIKIYDILAHKQNPKDYILFTLLVLLIILFRNNGIYTIILSLPFLFIKKEVRKAIAIILIINIALYQGYNKVLLPHFEIANTSIREMLSVPFQQTARYVKYYSDEITEEDKKIIDVVLEYDTLAERYDYDLSDPVKNKYNKYTTNEQLMDYFKVWFKYLWQRPGVYIDATMSNIYGYYYPNTSKWYIYTGLNEKLPEAGFDYHFNNLSVVRNILTKWGESFPYIPLVGSIANIGFIVWAHILIIGMLIVNKMKKYIIVLIPSITLILTCFVGPANTYFRYILPSAFALPFTICILYTMYLKEKNNNE